MTSLRHLRSSTANKRPDPAAMVDGQLAMNYDIASPGLFFKDDNGTLIKVGPVHVGTTAPNVSPAAGGTAGNSIGEQWLDTTSGVYVLKVWDGSAWRSESGTFVDVSGDTMTGALTMANQQAVRFSETTANGSNYIALQATAALASNKTITLPDTTGTVVTTGDTGTVTSTMIANDTILNADVNASAAIAGSKVSPDFGSQTVATTGIFSHALGGAATPSITFTGDTNTGIYSPGADQLAVSTGGTGRLFVDASGRVGIGTSSPDANLAIRSNRAVNTYALTVGTANGASFENDVVFTFNGSTQSIGNFQNFPLAFLTNNTERLRIDSSGRLLVGTSTARSTYLGAGVSAGINVEAAGNLAANNRSISIVNGYSLTADGDPIIYLGRTRSDTIGGTTVVQSSDAIGRIAFVGSDGTNMLPAAQIRTEVDGTPGTNDMPGRLVFSTTADGASSPTERIRINSAGTTTLTSATSTAPFIAKISSTEAARIDSSGRLLVGTSTARSNVYMTTVATTPQVEFDFNDNSYNAGVSLINYSGTGFAPALTLGLSQNNTRGTNAALNSGVDMGIINFVGNDGTNFRTGATITAATDATTGTGDMPGRLVFSTTADGSSTPTERMRIVNTGTTSIFASTANVLGAGSNQAAGTTYYLFYGANNASSTTTGTTCFLVYTNGNVLNTNNSYGAISDIKLKENIVDATPQWNDIKALQVRKYNFKEGQTHTQIGLIAQEVELVSPGLVTESPDRDAEGNDLGTVTKGIHYSVLYMKAVKALQEAMERIETLEAAVAALQGA